MKKLLLIGALLISSNSVFAAGPALPATETATQVDLKDLDLQKVLGTAMILGFMFMPQIEQFVDKMSAFFAKAAEKEADVFPTIVAGSMALQQELNGGFTFNMLSRDEQKKLIEEHKEELGDLSGSQLNEKLDELADVYCNQVNSILAFKPSEMDGTILNLVPGKYKGRAEKVVSNAGRLADGLGKMAAKFNKSKKA